MSTPFVVAKFGGTSVANYESIVKCADIVKANSDIKVIVVSAQSMVTNNLEKITKSSIRPINYEQVLLEIRNITFDIAHKLGKNINISKKINRFFDDLSTLSKISSRMYNEQLNDEIISFGERISAVLTSEIFLNLGINVEHIDARKIIKTSKHHGRAKPDLEKILQKTKDIVLPCLKKNKIILLEGFIGSNSKGATTVLGRGGSDYTAALISEAISAKHLMIWTDVTGVYETDPRIIKRAKVIDRLSFNEASELSVFGAKVLHASTLMPAIRKKMKIFVGSTFSPSKGGSWIVPEEDQKHAPIARGIALRSNQTLITLESIGMYPNLLSKIFNTFSELDINFDIVTVSEFKMALVLNQPSMDDLTKEELFSALSKHGKVKIKFEEKLSLIALIGNNLHLQKGIGNKLFNSMKNYNLRLFCHGASDHNICIVLHKKDEELAINDIYQCFF